MKMRCEAGVLRKVVLILIVMPVISCTAQVAGIITTGGREMSDDWGVDMTAALFTIAVQPEEFPIAFEAGYGLSTGNMIFEEYQIRDYCAGILKQWQIKESKAHYFIGGGITKISAEYEPFIPPNYKDSVTGYYLHTGVFWRFENTFNLGIDYRYNFADNLDLGSSHDPSGFVISGFFGWRL